MARYVGLKNGFLFYTEPERRILLTQAQPQIELPGVLKPHELKQVDQAIKNGIIQYLSTQEELVNNTPKETAKETQKISTVIAEFLENSISNIKKELDGFVALAGYAGNSLPLYELLLEQEMANKARKSVIKFFESKLNKMSGISGVADTDTQTIIVNIGGEEPEDFEQE